LVARLSVDTSEIPPYKICIAYLSLRDEDTIRGAVWLGRHPAEKVSVGPNGQLIRFRNPE